MDIALHLRFENMEPSATVRAEIEREMRHLEKFRPRVTACHITVTAPSARHRSGALNQVHIQMSVPPHQDVVVSRSHGDKAVHEHLSAAIKDAFAAARRQLEELIRRDRGDVKVHAVEAHGRVSKFIAGDDYGFIESSDGREIYFHRNSVIDNGFARLIVGSQVRFVEALGEHGPQATTVQVIGKHHLIDDPREKKNHLIEEPREK